MMPAFYISNTINKTNNFEIFKRYFTECKTISGGGVRLDLFYNENDSCFVSSDKDYLFAIGVFIYKNEWNGKALRLFLDDYENGGGLTELLLGTRGQFCLVMYHKKTFSIITDKAGATPIYCYKKGGTIEISNIFMPLAKNNDISLNYDWVARYVSGGKKGNMYYYDKTPANEVAVLDCGSIYYLDRDIRTAQYYDICGDLKMGKYTNPAEIENNVEKMLAYNLSFLGDADRVYCDITGGFDTRTNLAILLKNKTKFNCGNQIPTEYKHQLNTGKYSDLLITRQIANLCNLEIDTYSDTKFKPEQEKWRKMAYELFGFLIGEWTLSRRVGYYSYVKNTNSILVAGLYGTELLAQSHYYRRWGQKNNWLDIEALLHRYYPYCDILRDSCYSEWHYNMNILNILETFLEHTDFENFNDAGTYLQNLMFYRTYFSIYHGVANAIMPIYSPFAEANFIRFMAQTTYKVKSRYSIQRSIISKLNPQLGDIETSHGYPATKITVKNFLRFIRIFNPWEPNTQYIGLPQRLLQLAIKSGSKLRYIPIKKIGEMPISQIIDKDKLNKQSRKDYTIISKLITLNRLLSDLGLIGRVH